MTYNERKKLDIVCLLDKSGSMAGHEKHTVDSFNEFIAVQKREASDDAEIFTTLILFDDNYNVIFKNRKLNEIYPLTVETYKGDNMGMTALNDAVGRAINAMSGSNVLFFIETDGNENFSKRFRSEQIKEMISQKKELGWEFVFMGSDLTRQETYTMANNFGITKDKVFAFTKTDGGYDSRIKGMSAVACNYAKAGASAVNTTSLGDLHDEE